MTIDHVKLDTVFEQLQSILHSLATVPDDLNTEEQQAVDAYKQTLMAELKPQITKLLSGLFDFTPPSTNPEHTPDKPATLPKTQNQTGEKQDWIDTILSGITKMQLLLSAAESQLEGHKLLGVDLSTIAAVLEDILDLVAKNLRSVIKLINGYDWQTLDVEGFLSAINAIWTHIRSLIEKLQSGACSYKTPSGQRCPLGCRASPKKKH